MTSEALTLSPIQRQVADALAQVRDATVMELVATANVSKSTVSKTLVRMEAAGLATRTLHSDGEIRLADTWSPAWPGGETPATETPVNLDEDVETCAPKPEEPAAEATLAAGQEPELEPDSGQVEAPSSEELVSSTATPVSPSPNDGRLAPGGLTLFVADRLAAHPEIDYTPTMISHLLGGRSAGAIANALERMCAAGAAVRTCEAPKRYRHAVSTVAAA